MEQAAAGGVVLLAEVQVDLAVRRLGLEPQAALEAFQVALERHGRCGGGYFAQDVADRQPVLDQREGDVGALAEDGADRVGGLGEPGQRAAPQRGEGPGEPDGLDDVGGGDLPALLPEQPGDLGEPALHRPVGGREEVAVPAGRGDPRAVSPARASLAGGSTAPRSGRS